MKRFKLRFNDPHEPLYSWVRQGNEWIQTLGGSRFAITGPWEVEGRTGTLLNNRGALDHLIFLSDPNSPDPILMQRGEAYWEYLGEMIDIE